MNKKAFIIAHYNEKGQVAPDLILLTKYLKIRGAEIIFVSTKLSDLNYQIVSQFAQVIRRDNYGYDFWSYKIGIDALGDLGKYDRVTVLNSSFIILSITTLCDSFLEDPTKQGLRGLSISHEKSKHIQSYWISFEGNILINSRIFKAWWEDMKPVSERQKVIDLYEIGISKYFIKNGVSISAKYEPSENDLMLATFRLLAAGKKIINVNNSSCIVYSNGAEKLNPTHFLWEKLLINCGIVKYDLIKNNNEQIPINSLYKLINKKEYLIKSLEINSIKVDVLNLQNWGD
jgi:rhamnosyltransferase